MEHVEFFRQCPLLVPESLDPLKADGYIDVAEGVRVRVTIDTEAAGGVYSVDAVKSTAEIERYLQARRQDLDTRLQQCTSALSFVRELQHILAGAPSNAPKRVSPFYAQIVDECDGGLGWDCISSFDEKEQLLVVRLE
ncbi:hypothetical protein IWQ56_000621 [Coemansia nantahalensis]|uniref:Uncharacterized protein n=1 Tax=Coemansia nantahalensis TaxID=2789366 RepID=A0ACC1K7R8_9FUNG|nr:hypothetical protein IWQ56_000621 [Coemansia nantahalensis]KAJ2775536.1 hypothetical protein IWQ57_000400 [Coemansia nantahalensis]